MCGRCVIFTFDEVLEVIREIEVGTPFDFEPDWPARRLQAYPKSAASLIVSEFDTALGVTSLREGSFSARDFTWGIRGIVEAGRGLQHPHRERDEADVARLHRTSSLHHPGIGVL